MRIHTHPGERPLNWAALIETAVLTLTAVMLLAKAQRGALAFYIHPRYTPLVVACGVVLLLTAGARMRAIFGRAPESVRGWRYLVLALPLLLGTLVPARPLGAHALSGLSTSATFGDASLATEDSRQWNILQWAMALSIQDEGLLGQEADVVGFVYHDPARPLDGFFAARYVISCCTADGSAAGLPVVWRGATLPLDSWVRVRGTIGTATIDGQVQPAVIATSVEPVERPANPYLYP
jgi:uncharacterized repeat protein (TIGR03943 family)